VLDAAAIKTFKISNGALKGQTLPSRLKIFGWGENETTKGNFRVGAKTAANLSANQKAGGYERVAIDFDHCTVPGTPGRAELIAAGQPPLIFGYGRPVAVAGEGMFLEDIQWTPLGAQHAKNFEDISPAVQDDAGEITLVHSVALTPNGAVKDLHFFNTTTQQNMDAKFISLSALAGILSLDATADEAAVLTKLKTALTPASPVDLSPLDARLKKLEEAGTKAIATLSATIDGKVHTFSAEDVVKLVTRVETLEGKFTASADAAVATERANIVKLFAAEGKVPRKADGANYSAAELATLDVPTLRLLHANTPVTVPIAARSATAQTDGAKSFKDAKGNVDLAAVFNQENAANP
jgi:hypothetical protein